MYRYSLDVVATSHELYSSFGMQSSAGRGRRGGYRAKGSISFFEGRGVSSINTFSPLSLLPPPASSFFSRSRPAKTTTINERIKALSLYYSLRLCSWIFSKAHDEREDKLVGKSSRCSRIRRPESPKSGPRGMDIGKSLRDEDGQGDVTQDGEKDA